jgi:hypothetical protein
VHEDNAGAQERRRGGGRPLQNQFRKRPPSRQHKVRLASRKPLQLGSFGVTNCQGHAARSERLLQYKNLFRAWRRGQDTDGRQIKTPRPAWAGKRCRYIPDDWIFLFFGSASSLRERVFGFRKFCPMTEKFDCIAIKRCIQVVNNRETSRYEQQ